MKTIFQICDVDLQKVALEELGREMTAVELDSAARYFESGMYWRAAASEAVQAVVTSIGSAPGLRIRGFSHAPLAGRSKGIAHFKNHSMNWLINASVRGNFRTLGACYRLGLRCVAPPRQVTAEAQIRPTLSKTARSRIPLALSGHALLCTLGLTGQGAVVISSSTHPAPVQGAPKIRSSQPVKFRLADDNSGTNVTNSFPRPQRRPS